MRLVLICLELLSGNPGKFILASMHDELKVKAQNIAQVPILYLNGPTPVLEKPSEKAVSFAESSAKNAVKEDQVRKCVACFHR